MAEGLKMPQPHPLAGKSEAVVIIKAAPQVGERHGETVCCAAIDLHGNWLRLYPVSFRKLDRAQKFARWDHIKFNWRKPSDDQRTESRRVEQQSIEIVGNLRPSDRERFLAKLIVTSLDRERAAGRSLALLKPRIQRFSFVKKSDQKLAEEKVHFETAIAQADLFIRASIPYTPCPYKFHYHYETDDGERKGKCQDWEIEATFHKWSRIYGETEALKKISAVFGEELPRKGMLLAMGTHSRYPDVWLINGIIRLNDVKQGSLI